MKLIEDFDEYYNNNPLAQKEDARFHSLSDEKKERLRLLEEQDVKEYQLRVIKRKRIKPQKGNLFVVSPKENMYFWGVVINSDIEFFKGDDERFSVVFILKDRAESPTDTNIPKNITNLLIDPAVVGRWYWNKGFFYNVGIDIEIPDDIDYGFYDIMGRQYVDEYENTIKRVPELVGVYGAKTGQGIAYEMNYELIASGMI